MPEPKIITASREASMNYMNETLPVKESFDIIQRDMVIRRPHGDLLFYRWIYQRRSHAQNHGFHVQGNRRNHACRCHTICMHCAFHT